nr:MFS transporter [Brevibacterium yomogidense]
MGTLAFALFVVGTNAFVVAGVLPAIGDSLSVTPTLVSYAISAYAILVAVLAPAFSMLLAHIPPERVMAAGMLTFAVGTGVSAIAPTYLVFFIARALAGVGAAALVPLATALAPRLAEPGRQGRAMAVVALGFTLAVALGSPVGTGLAEITNWRVAIGGLAVLGAVLGLTMATLLRGVPTNPKVSLAARMRVLADPRVVMGVIAIMMMIMSFNLIYVFSSEVTSAVTGGDGAILALLLLVFGLAGAVGNQLGGWLIDTWGDLRTMRIALVAEIAAFLLMLLTLESLAGTALVFALWGVSGFASVVALQHRLASLRPEHSAIVLSWYSTGMYVGISLAPVIGAAVLLSHGPLGLAVSAALAAAVALVMTVPVRSRS